MKFLFSGLFILHSLSLLAQPSRNNDVSEKITIEGTIPPGYSKNTITLGGYPIPVITLKSEDEFSIEQPVQERSAKWEINSSKPVFVYGQFFNCPRTMNFLLEPGDNIHIEYTANEYPVFKGTGAKKFELTWILCYLLDSLNNNKEYWKIMPRKIPVIKVEDFIRWNAYLDGEIRILMPILEKYEHQISHYAFSAIKEMVLNEIEYKRLEAFERLVKSTEYLYLQSDTTLKNIPLLTNDEFCKLFDSTMNGPAANWLQYETPVVGFAHYYYQRSFLDGCREKGKFIRSQASDSALLGKEKVDSYVFRYNLIKRKYKGVIRESALAWFFHFPKGVLKSIGFDPKIETLLTSYYKQSEYPEYARAVKNFELRMRDKKSGSKDLPFTLTTTSGEEITKSQLKGKLTLIDFWFTGCKGCIQLNPYLLTIEKQFQGNPNIQFVNVSVDEDKEKWTSSLMQKKYTTANGISLFTSGMGMNHPLLKNYLITSFPALLLFDNYGRSISEDFYADPRRDSGKSLTKTIRQQLSFMKDGPFIFNGVNNSVIYSLDGSNINHTTISSDSNTVLWVQPDSGQHFSFELKKKLQTEPSTFKQPSRMFIFSDIEGNFEALRKLLIANGVIDENFNWTFGNGHIVFNGDMFDRGLQVTECLWLLYSLENKAIQSGGYVHYILGNHEIMNLQGDHRYTQIKYKQNAALLNQTPRDLYGQQSELGRWLRTKNIVEKIGNMLFIHGGISTTINQTGLSPEKINQIARPYYDKIGSQYPDSLVKMVMNDRGGIFWYRDYYQLERNKIEPVIDATLHLFKVDHIFTGHTIVADTATVHFNGKLFNTDTRHAEGKSEGIYIENGSFYRVNERGDRKILFKNSMRTGIEHLSKM